MRRKREALPSFTFQKNGNISIWWFDKNFTQSKYGEFQESGRNSCTLIALLVAAKVSKECVFTQTHSSLNHLPHRAVEIFAESINEGNEVYRHLSSTKAMRSKNLNIPEALEALQTNRDCKFLHELFYMHTVIPETGNGYSRSASLKLLKVLNAGLNIWKASGYTVRDNLLVAIIAANRTILLVIQPSMKILTLFDSHQHGQDAGAVIAQSTVYNLYDFVVWIVKTYNDFYSSQPEIYELSFLNASCDSNLPSSSH